MHDSEDTVSNSLLYFTMDMFHKKRIYELFGISLSEYLQQPREYNELLHEIADKHMAKKQSAINTIENELNQQMK